VTIPADAATCNHQHPRRGTGQAPQIDDDVANRFRAANENVAVGRLVEWVWCVDDLPRNQAALTGVTDTGPGRPTDRDVACLGQLQDALVGRRLPVCGDATARERYQRTGVGIVLRQVRSSRGPGGSKLWRFGMLGQAGLGLGARTLIPLRMVQVRSSPMDRLPRADAARSVVPVPEKTSKTKPGFHPFAQRHFENPTVWRGPNVNSRKYPPRIFFASFAN
jgi:hypothetical protein